MKCKNCKIKLYKEKQNDFVNGINRFCSKKCRLDFGRAEMRKIREKEKTKKMKVRAKKQDTITKIKKRLWNTISLYIRLRDSDDDNFCKCITCPEDTPKRHYKDSIQAGHYIASGQSSFHRYNEKNIHPQCYGCNVGKHGNTIEYRPFMIKKYGQEYTDYLYETRNDFIKLGKEELKEIHQEYKIKLAELKLNKILD